MPPFLVDSPDIAAVSLHAPVSGWLRPYVLPYLVAYPAAAYAYTVRYDDWIADQANTFILCVLLIGTHALSWLTTQWSTEWRAMVTAVRVSSSHPRRHARIVLIVFTYCSVQRDTPATASLVKITPVAHRGQPEITKLHTTPGQAGKPDLVWFSYQRDKFTLNPENNTFGRLAYPCDDASLTIQDYQDQRGLSTQAAVEEAKTDYGKNHFDIPVPTFRELFAEHAQAPFFVFQIFCVGLWCLDEYWYYSLFTLFMLVIFECTTVWQRQRTLNEFRTMSIKPYAINVYRERNWMEIQTDDLLPGDIVSVGELLYLYLRISILLRTV